MKHLAMALTVIAGLFIAILFVATGQQPVTYNSNGDEITTVHQFSTMDTLTVDSGEAEMTITAYYVGLHTEPVILEVRLNNDISQLEREELLLGVPGTLYTRKVVITSGDTLTTLSNAVLKLHIDGAAQFTITHNSYWDNLGELFIIALLTLGAVCVIGLIFSMHHSE